MTEEKEQTQLEKEFEAAYKVAIEEIDAKLSIASVAIKDAEKIAEKYGVPFYAYGVSPLSQPYTPKSYQEKFGELDPDFVADIADVWPGEDYDGWAHSAVC